MKKTALSLSLLLMWGAATAQESHPDSTDVFYKHLELEETVVTGLAGDTKMKEMPAPVSVVRPADLAARAGGNIISAIAAEPRVSEITTGGASPSPSSAVWASTASLSSVTASVRKGSSGGMSTALKWMAPVSIPLKSSKVRRP
jgi:hypothetical protein